MNNRYFWMATVSAIAMILGSAAGTTASATTIPSLWFACAAPATSSKAGSPSSSSLSIGLNGNDPTQTYTLGSKFTVSFNVESTSADQVGWQIATYDGVVHASGTIAVPAGATTASVSCSSTLAGYFSVSARLNKSGATEPWQGSRPAGFVAFGVLPNDVSDFVPAFNSSLNTRRFGLVGFQDVLPGTGIEPLNEDMGTSWITDQRSMSTTEPQSAGQYNPSTYQIDPSLKEGTLARLIYMNGIPYWASTAPSPGAFGSYPPKSFSAFQSYSALVGEESARLNKNYIPNQHKNYYQVSWEPDPGPSTQWMGSDAQFIELYQAAWNGVHSTDPDAAVMGPATQSLPICASWLERLVPEGLGKYLDAVSCHGYYIVGASSALPPEAGDLPAQVQTLRQAMAKVLPAGTKLFVTETGISYPMGSHYASNFPTSTVLTEHAEAVVRTHLIMLGEGVDTSFVFYSADFLEHAGFGMYFNLDVQTNPWSGNIEPKPAAMAIAAASRLVDGSRSLGALTNMSSGQYGYSFLLANSTQVITALWAHNSTFNAGGTYELQVAPTGTSGTVVMFSAMGNAKSAAYSNGLVNVTLGEMPVYVLSNAISEIKTHSRAPVGYSTSF